MKVGGGSIVRGGAEGFRRQEEGDKRGEQVVKVHNSNPCILIMAVCAHIVHVHRLTVI